MAKPVLVTLAVMGMVFAGCKTDPQNSDSPSTALDFEPNPVSWSGTPCTKPLDIDCPDGFVDGCDVAAERSKSGRLTRYHVCVDALEVVGTSPCSVDAQAICGGDQIDACQLEPAAAGQHLCIINPAEPAETGYASWPAADCSEPVDLDCGKGFVDGCDVSTSATPTGRLTRFHICVAEETADAHTSCNKDPLAQRCAEGQINGCLLTPSASTHNVCVVDPDLDSPVPYSVADTPR